MLDKLFAKKRGARHSEHYVYPDHIRRSFESCQSLLPEPQSPSLDMSCPCSDEDLSPGVSIVDPMKKKIEPSFESCQNVPPSAPQSPGLDTCPCSNEDLSNEVSIIEPSIPAPILVSDASIEDFQRCLPKAAASEPSPSPLQPQDSQPQSDVEELYFNNWVKSNPSVLGKPDTNQVSRKNSYFAKKSCSYAQRDGKKPAHSMPLCKIMQESGNASSAGEAVWGAEDRAQYYHNKLLSTLKVLENREETMRVQAESLRVAESRIAALSARATRLRDQLQRQAAEDSQQQNMVRCLQTNLHIIEDLYRECFYETVKQEELIETLRESYLEEKRPRRSARDLQDITTEVDSLKLDISNFLNNSNSDSGVWERGGDEWDSVGADLRDIAGQLLRLQHMLTVDCTCGLEEENMRLKNANETLEIQLSETRNRLSELEATLAGKEDPEQYKKEIEEKSQELQNIIEKMAKLEESIAEKNTECDSFSRELHQSQVSLEDQCKQLSEARRRQAALDSSVRALRAELEEATHRADESQVLCEELRRRESETSLEARALRAELTRVRGHLARLDAVHREQTQESLSLQSQLQQAHARGAVLCAEVRAVVDAVHQWLRKHRNREDKIKEQDTIIKALQHSLAMYQKDDATKAQDEDDLCCRKCVAGRCRMYQSETASCSKWKTEEERCNEHSLTSGSEVASPSSVPTPPQRLRKQSDVPCARRRSAGVQRPYRQDASLHALPDRSRSASRELQERVMALSNALEHAQPRWAHTR